MSIIYDCFQGELEVVKEIPNKRMRETSKMVFLMLGLDLPPPPLFKDVMEENMIPQVKLFDILRSLTVKLSQRWFVHILQGCSTVLPDCLSI
jgi:hypothetical protein